jgi:type IV fimbrial biogenesis protein FimT
MRTAQRVTSVSGFTLLELMMTVAILAIVVSVGVPSLMDTIRNNRLASGANELVTSMALARSEASKRGIQVSVCPRNGNVCADTTDWSNGWLVFTDDVAPTGALDGPSDLLLQQSATMSGPVSITSDLKSVTFTPAGVRTRANMVVTQSGCKGKNKRAITVELTGRVTLQKQDC